MYEDALAGAWLCWPKPERGAVLRRWHSKEVREIMQYNILDCNII